MAKKEIVTFTPKYRDTQITVNSHPEPGICSVDLGGAVVYGTVGYDRKGGKTGAFEVRDKGHIIVREYVDEDVAGLLREHLEGANE